MCKRRCTACGDGASADTTRQRARSQKRRLPVRRIRVVRTGAVAHECSARINLSQQHRNADFAALGIKSISQIQKRTDGCVNGMSFVDVL